MKKLLYLVTILPLFAQAQNNALSGKWRETRREIEGYSRDFSDTIKIDFLAGQEYTWMKKGGFIYRGTYKIDKNILDMGSRVFTIVSRTDKKIVLKDDDARYEFTPYTDAPIEKLPQEKPMEVPANISAITGKWTVFKRTSATVQKQIDYTTQIKHIVLFGQQDDSGNWGYVLASADPSTEPSWQIERYENGILYCKGKSIRKLEVLNGDKELVIKEGAVTYFLKQFKE